MPLEPSRLIVLMGAWRESFSLSQATHRIVSPARNIVSTLVDVNSIDLTHNHQFANFTRIMIKGANERLYRDLSERGRWKQEWLSRKFVWCGAVPADDSSVSQALGTCWLLATAGRDLSTKTLSFALERKCKVDRG
jgi:hypothetical protein